MENTTRRIFIGAVTEVFWSLYLTQIALDIARETAEINVFPAEFWTAIVPVLCTPRLVKFWNENVFFVPLNVGKV